MTVKLITPCVGKRSCHFFRTPEKLLEVLEVPKDFQNLMMAIEITKTWKSCDGCPFKVKASDEGDGEAFHVSICSLASRPPFSMEAVSRGTGYSKTRVAQIEYTAFRKMKRVLGKATFENEVLEKV